MDEAPTTSPAVRASGDPDALPRLTGAEVLEQIRRGGFERLGIGGFCAVFAGVGRDGAPTAVKKFSPTRCQVHFGERAAAVVLREAERLRGFGGGAHFMRVLGYCADADNPPAGLGEAGMFAIVFERLEPLDPRVLPTAEQRLLAARDVLRALAQMHARGLIHRDVKVANCFLRRLSGGGGAAAVLGDFGVSRELSRHDGRTFTVTAAAGTDGYAAPEIDLARGRRCEAHTRSDIYSCGVTLLRLFVGTVGDVGFDALVGGAFALAGARDEIPAPLRPHVLQMLRRDPAERPTAASLLEALDAHLGGAALAPLAAVPPTAAERRGLAAAFWRSGERLGFENDEAAQAQARADVAAADAAARDAGGATARSLVAGSAASTVIGLPVSSPPPPADSAVQDSPSQMSGLPVTGPSCQRGAADLSMPRAQPANATAGQQGQTPAPSVPAPFREDGSIVFESDADAQQCPAAMPSVSKQHAGQAPLRDSAIPSPLPHPAGAESPLPPAAGAAAAAAKVCVSVLVRPVVENPSDVAGAVFGLTAKKDLAICSLSFTSGCLPGAQFQVFWREGASCLVARSREGWVEVARDKVAVKPGNMNATSFSSPLLVKANHYYAFAIFGRANDTVRVQGKTQNNRLLFQPDVTEGDLTLLVGQRMNGEFSGLSDLPALFCGLIEYNV